MLPTGGPGPKVFREDSEGFVPAVALCAQDRGDTSIPVARAQGLDCSIGVSEAAILALALLESGCNLSSQNHCPGMAAGAPPELFPCCFFFLFEGLTAWGTATVVVEPITGPDRIWAISSKCSQVSGLVMALVMRSATCCFVFT